MQIDDDFAIEVRAGLNNKENNNAVDKGSALCPDGVASENKHTLCVWHSWVFAIISAALFLLSPPAAFTCG